MPSKPSEIAERYLTKPVHEDQKKLGRAYLLLRDEITAIAEDSPIGQIRNALWLSLSKVEEHNAIKAE